MRVRHSVPCLTLTSLTSEAVSLIVPTPALNVVSIVYSLTHIPADSVHMHASSIVYVIIK